MSLSSRSNHANGVGSHPRRRRVPAGYVSRVLTGFIPTFIRSYFSDTSNDYEMLERSPPTSPRNGIVNGVLDDEKAVRSDSDGNMEISSPSSATSPSSTHFIEISTDHHANRRRKHRQHRLPDTLLTRSDSALNLTHTFHRGHDQIELSPHESPQERNAQIALKQALDNARPLRNSELLIVLAAGIVALGACSTSKAFGDRFIEGVEEFTGSPIPSATAKIIVEYFVGWANLTTQFSLTTTSFIQVASSFLRVRNIPKHEFIQILTATEKTILFLVTLTAFSSAKMVFDTTSDVNKLNLNLWLCIVLSGLSYLSSLAVNTNFTYDRLMSLRPERNDLAIIRLLKQTKYELDMLALNSNHQLFINRIANGTWFHQLRHLNTGLTPKEQLEDIIEQLIKLSDMEIQYGLFVAKSYKDLVNAFVISSVSLGGIGSAVNAKAGLDVPQFVSFKYLPVAHFTDLKTWKDQLSLGLGLIFGSTAWTVNTIINGRSCYNLERSMVSLWREVNAFGLANYNNKMCGIFLTIFLLSLGYAIGKAGSTLKYALFEGEEVPTDVIALVTLFVCLGLGIYSMQAAVGKAINRYDWSLMDNALAERDLLEYYKTLNPAHVEISEELSLHDEIPTLPINQNGHPHNEAKEEVDPALLEDPTEMQWTLRKLLYSNSNLAIDALIAHFNQIRPNIKDADLFSPRIVKMLEDKFGRGTLRQTSRINEINSAEAALPVQAPLSNSPIMLFTQLQVVANQDSAQSGYRTGYNNPAHDIRPRGYHTPRPVTPRPIIHSSSSSFSHAPLDATNDQLGAEGSSPVGFRRPRGYGSFHGS